MSYDPGCGDALSLPFVHNAIPRTHLRSSLDWCPSPTPAFRVSVMWTA